MIVTDESSVEASIIINMVKERAQKINCPRDIHARSLLLRMMQDKEPINRMLAQHC